MLKPYTFLSDEEPSDEQLQELTEAVLTEVKERAFAAEQKFKALQAEQIEDAIQARRHRMANNG